MYYKTVYEYIELSYDGLGEEVQIPRTATRYFDSYGKHEDFLQTFDMVGEPTDQIISDKSISNARHYFFLVLAYLVYFCRGYYFKAGRELFYKMINASYTRSINHSLCQKFDDKAFSVLTKKGDIEL